MTYRLSLIFEQDMFVFYEEKKLIHYMFKLCKCYNIFIHLTKVSINIINLLKYGQAILFIGRLHDN